MIFHHSVHFIFVCKPSSARTSADRFRWYLIPRDYRPAWLEWRPVGQHTIGALLISELGYEPSPTITCQMDDCRVLYRGLIRCFRPPPELRLCGGLLEVRHQVLGHVIEAHYRRLSSSAFLALNSVSLRVPLPCRSANFSIAAKMSVLPVPGVLAGAASCIGAVVCRGAEPSIDTTGRDATATTPCWLEKVSDPPTLCCCEKPPIW